MKRIVICAFILLVLVALGIVSYIYTNNAMESTGDTIDRISTSFENGDFEKTRSLSTSLSENWRESYNNYLLIFDKEHIMELTMAIARIEALAEDENPDLLIECKSASELIRLYRSKEKLRIVNIL